MAWKAHTAGQLIGMLWDPEVRLAKGEKIGAICWGWVFRSRATIVGGLKATQAVRLRSLEKERAPRRKAVSNLTLDALILKEVIEGKF
jgi:hypothetical protein